MPASLPGATVAQNQGNPNQGQFVIFDPLSGPKGSPLDAMRSTGTYSASPVNMPVRVADPLNLSTGALSTGIGIGANRVIRAGIGAIVEAGYDDDGIPGQRPAYTYPPKGNVTSNTVDSTRMYIGGGRMITNPAVDDRGVPFIPSPYTAGVAIAGAGNGGSRDGGVGPSIFTGFQLKTVTAAGTVANGAAVEGSFNNRSGVAITIGQSVFGSDTAALAAPS